MWGLVCFCVKIIVGTVFNLGLGHCCFIVGRVYCCVGLFVRAGFIVGPKSLLLLVYCWGASIVGWGSLLCVVNCRALFDFKNEFIFGDRSLLGRINCCMGFIVGVGFIVSVVTLLVLVNCFWDHCFVKIVLAGFIVGPRTLLFHYWGDFIVGTRSSFVVHCWGGSIVALVSLLKSG